MVVQGVNQEMARQYDIEAGISPKTTSVVVQLLVETLSKKAEIEVVDAI